MRFIIEVEVKWLNWRCTREVFFDIAVVNGDVDSTHAFGVEIRLFITVHVSGVIHKVDALFLVFIGKQSERKFFSLIHFFVFGFAVAPKHHIIISLS